MNEKVLKIARKQNFNMKLFSEFQVYQNEHHNECYGKYTHEVFAALLSDSFSDIDFFEHVQLEWFSIYCGFGSFDSLPDYFSFLKYCYVRNLEPYNLDKIVLERK